MKRGMEPFLVLNRTISSKSAVSAPKAGVIIWCKHRNTHWSSVTTPKTGVRCELIVSYSMPSVSGWVFLCLFLSQTHSESSCACSCARLSTASLSPSPYAVLLHYRSPAHVYKQQNSNVAFFVESAWPPSDPSDCCVHELM